MELDAKFWVESDDPSVQREIHLIEAATATRFESGHQVEIQLGHYCNNRCVFCVSGQLTEEGLARPIAIDPIVEALEASAAGGIKKVTFLGGEPTIQQSFLEALDRAVALGFEEIVIFTNGARGASPAWLDAVRARGRFTWRFSLQGANEASHEAVTQRRRSWRRIMGAVTHLAEAGEDLTANMCVTRQSAASLPEFPALLARNGVRQLHIDMVRPNNAGQRTDAWLRDIIPRHVELRPHLEAMLEGFEAIDPDWDVNVGNYPYCLLPAWANKIHHGGEPTLTLTTGHKGELDRLLKKYDYQRIDAVYAEGCAGCVFRPSCRGVPARYAELFGTDELTPLSLDELRARDTAQRSFAIVALPTVAPLLERAPPEGLTARGLVADQRGRRVTLGLSDAVGRAVDVIFTPVVRPPRGLPEPAVVSEWLEVRVSAGPAVGRATLKALLRWLLVALPELEGVGSARLARRSGAALRRGRLEALATALTDARRLGAWTVRRADGPGDAAIVHFDGPAGARVALTLATREDGRTRADFSLGANTTSEGARPVIEAARAVLAGLGRGATGLAPGALS